MAVLEVAAVRARYEVYCIEGRSVGDSALLLVGETDDPTGGLLVDVVNKHPAWHTPNVIERKSRQVVMAQLPGSWPFPDGGDRG